MPFNQGSKQDVEALIEYIYDTKKGCLGWDLDFVVPFAAIPENGREIDSIDSKSELAHRIMLTNLLRLLGCIKTQKQERGFETRPAQVILPLSPNHGTFGNDGLYSESSSHSKHSSIGGTQRAGAASLPFAEQSSAGLEGLALCLATTL